MGTDTELSLRFVLGFGVLLSTLPNGCFGLRSVEIHVPEAVEAGTAAKLECHYDLEQVALYSIKWYRDDQEFYRFVPRETPPSRVFPQGIRVDLSKSNAQHVTLRDVRRHHTGFYKCEVSSEAPLFHTEIKSALMIVVDLPRDKPRVSVEKLKYTQGERIRANCTAPATYPAINLTWVLNKKEVQHSPPDILLTPRKVVTLEKPAVLGDMEEFGEMEEEESKQWGVQEVAELDIDVKAGPTTFVEGRVRLRCLGTLFTLYRQTTEVILEEDVPQIAPVMGPTAPHSLDIACRAMSFPSTLLAVAFLLILASR